MPLFFLNWYIGRSIDSWQYSGPHICIIYATKIRKQYPTASNDGSIRIMPTMHVYISSKRNISNYFTSDLGKPFISVENLNFHEIFTSSGCFVELVLDDSSLARSSCIWLKILKLGQTNESSSDGDNAAYNMQDKQLNLNVDHQFISTNYHF